MTKPSMALAELVEKGSQDEVVRELLAHVAERLMESEIEQRTGAAYGERTAERSNSRNGYRERLWETPRWPPKVYRAWPLQNVPGVGGHFEVYQ